MTRMTSPRERRRGSITLACAAACSLLLALSAPAGATVASDFCISASGSANCPAGSLLKPSLEQAVADASIAQETRIFITPGTYTASSSFNLGGKPLKILGIGEPKPVLTAPAGPPGKPVISTVSSLLDLTNVTIAIPASQGMIGLKASGGGQEISGVSVRGQAASGSVGISIGDSNPTISRTDIQLDGSGGSSTGISMYASTTPRLEDVQVSAAARGVEISASTNFSIRRARVATPQGLKVENADGTISSSLIEVPAGSTTGQAAIDLLSGAHASASLNVFNCTLVQRAAAPGTGITSRVDGADGHAGVTVDSSIISGFQSASANAGDSATVTLRYSAFDGSLEHADAGTIVEGASNIPQADAFGFRDRTGGDFHLVLNSPLVDRGNPVIGDFSQADSGNDLDGLPRVVSRGAGKIRDIGAYEVQNSAPVPAIAILTSVPSTTAITEFSAAGSSDAEGDELSYEWSFDGLPGPGGVGVSKRFITAGPHNVQLTVTDRAGASQTVRRQFDVAIGYLNVKLRSESVQITRRGFIRVTLSCPAAAISDCTGRLLLRSVKLVDAKRYTKRPGWISSATHIEAANHVFALAPGESRRVAVRTTRAFQNVLGVKKRFQVTGALTHATTGNAKLVSNRATYTVRAPRTKRH